MDDKSKKHKTNRGVSICVYIMITLIVLFAVGMLVDGFIKQIKKPTLETISKEFENFKHTNNTAIFVDSNTFGFGYSTVSLFNLVYKGNSTGDGLISNNKLYFSYNVQDITTRQDYCVIYECDFYGNNVKKLFSTPIEEHNTYKCVEDYNNSFYMSNGTKIVVFYPQDNRKEEITYNGYAEDYVKELKHQTELYTVVEEKEKEIFIKNMQTAQVYTINAKTFDKTLEGKSLLKFSDYELVCSISKNRILITARIQSNNTFDDPYVTYEYDTKSNKLFFQNYCVLSRSYFKTYSY